MQDKTSETPQESRRADVWQVVETAASRVPDWVYKTPVQPQSPSLNIAGKTVTVIPTIDEP